MAVASINNPAAMGAQSEVRRALGELEGVVARMSSGNAIDTASRDVAALSLGTTLNQNIISLRAAHKNTAQATNVLRVVEGAYKNISSIIAKQKALAGQATAGSLDSATRGYLNQQFQGLQDQINSIVSSTTFNGIKLIDGSLFAPNKMDSNVDKQTAHAKGTLNFASAIASGDNGKSININGVNVMLRNNANASAGTEELNLNVEANTTAAGQAAALKELVDNVLVYQGTDANVLAAKAKFSELSFDYTAGGTAITMTARAAGSAANHIQVGAPVALGGANINLDGITNVHNTVADLATSARGSLGKDGAITSGQFNGMNAAGTLNIGATPFNKTNDLAKTISINGASITIRDTATIATGTAMLNLDAEVNATADQQILGIRNIVENVRGYTGTDTTTLAAKAKFNELDFEWGLTSVKIISKKDGSAGNAVQIGTSTGTVATVDIDGTSIKANTVNLATETRGTYVSSNMINDGKVNGFKASGTINIETAMVGGDATKTISLNGAAITIVNGGTPGTLDLDVAAATTAQLQAAAIKTIFDNVLAYSGTDTTILAAKAKFEQLELAVNGAEIRVTAKNVDPNDGSAINGNTVKIAAGALTAPIRLNGRDLTSASLDLATATHGTFVTKTARVSTVGVTGDTLIKDLSNSNKYATGFDASGVTNNSHFVGRISGFKAVKTADNFVNLEVKVGDHTYKANGVKTNVASDTMVVFKDDSPAKDGGSFMLQFAANKGMSVTSDADVATFASRLDKAVGSVEVFQDRDVTNYKAEGKIRPAGSASDSGNLAGTSFDYVSDSFGNAQIEKIKISAPAAGQSNAVIEFVADGKTFRADDFGSSLAAHGRLNIAQTDKASSMFQFVNSDMALELDTPEKAAAAQAALEGAFGIKNGGSGLNFQVGSNASDNISVQLKSAGTAEIYKDKNGVSQNIDLTTEANAKKANEILDEAAKTVTSLLANVGALQTRFQSTADNLESSIQNQDAARSVYLDTDAAKESTELTKQQTLLNAGIAVLAQANQFASMLGRLFQ